jgi:hypothetical protein
MAWIRTTLHVTFLLSFLSGVQVLYKAHKFCMLKFRYQYACRLHSKFNEVLAFSLLHGHLIYCKNLNQILWPKKRPVNALQLIKRPVDEKVIQL